MNPYRNPSESHPQTLTLDDYLGMSESVLNEKWDAAVREQLKVIERMHAKGVSAEDAHFLMGVAALHELNLQSIVQVRTYQLLRLMGQ